MAVWAVPAVTEPTRRNLRKLPAQRGERKASISMIGKDQTIIFTD